MAQLVLTLAGGVVGGGIAGGLGQALGALFAAYDFLAPAISSVDVSLLSAHVPPWAWPLILIFITALLQFLRNLSDKRHQAELAEGPASVQEG